ncbi:MAG: lipoyl(octanoyl) transferase LipB, partial [Puniceicoccales bacterium]
MALTIEDWGRTAYTDAFERQLERVEERLDGEIGDTLILTEHDSVYTIGARHGAEKHLLLDPDALTQKGITVAKTNRGGDITWHGPGQIVGYPVVSLADTRDLHAYLRKIEQLIINVLGSLGLAADRREGLTGIWLGTRKIAAIGVAVKRWVTYHGFALNVNCDLGNFGGIVPCG